MRPVHIQRVSDAMLIGNEDGVGSRFDFHAFVIALELNSSF